MLYQLKRLAINQEQKSLATKSQRRLSLNSNGKSVDRKRLLEQIESITQNSEGRVKAIEVCFRLNNNEFTSVFLLSVLERRKITRTSFELCKSIRDT